MQNNTQTAIEEEKNYIQKERATLESIAELLTALHAHTGKLVDKRFFLEHFKVSNEYRDWTKYSITAPRYDWSKHSNELYISADCRLELMSRETAHIIEKVEAEQQRARDYIARLTNEIEKLEGFDEAELVRELLALYEKHGKPETWRKVLDSYEVKYPASE